VVPVPWTADWQLLTQANTVKLAFGSYDPAYPLVLMFGIPEAMGGGGQGPCKPPLKQVQVNVETPNLDQDEEEQIHRDADRSDTARA
jgi:hypothetical protein